MHLYVGHPEAKRHEVYLNGEPILYAVEADDVEGYVHVLRTVGEPNRQGYRQFAVERVLGDETILAEYETLTGRVEFKRVENEDNWPYKWMTPEQKAACRR